MDGFGASFTESSGYALSALQAEERDALMIRFSYPVRLALQLGSRFFPVTIPETSGATVVWVPE